LFIYQWQSRILLLREFDTRYCFWMFVFMLLILEDSL
jgi:hypothetical protein